MLNSALILETAKMIEPYINHPQLDSSIYLSTEKRRVYFKNEGLQHTKSFKLRGVMSKLLRLSEAEKKRGVVAVSSGNHGIAVSYACKIFGIDKALIFVPKNTPKAKTEKIEHYGASLMIEGACYDEAHSIGMAYVEAHDMVYIDAYDKDEIVYAGQGTIGLEILLEMPYMDSLLIPIGGGGLITGIGIMAKALNPDIKIIGVQTEACPAMKASMDDKKLYKTFPSKASMCEGLIGGIGALAFEHSKQVIDDILLVSEASIQEAMRHMMIKEKLIVEPSSATVIAALMSNPNYDFGKHVTAVISGANIDGDLMKTVLGL